MTLKRVACIAIVSVSFLAAAPVLYAAPAASSGLVARFDANRDGILTRAEIDEGLKAEFALADTNRDGRLSPAEITAENSRRLKRDGIQAAPVRDWNGDGIADLTEFSTAARSYFAMLDTDGRGEVRVQDLRDASLALPAPRATLGDLNADSDDANGFTPSSVGSIGGTSGTGY